MIILKLMKNRLNHLTFLFAATFIAVFSFFYNSKTIAQSTILSIPSSGSCALLLTLPIPYGKNVAANTNSSGVNGVYQTGYNLIGQITFTNSKKGTFSGRIINPTFNTTDSPYIDASNGVLNINNFQVAIAAMNASTGFIGGYTFTFSGSLNGKSLNFELIGVPSNSGKTIVMASSRIGTIGNPGIGPGSGICQV